jgi:hypothetical protein
VLKEIKSFGSGINYIEDFISKDTCSFLVKHFESSLTPTPDANILGGPSFIEEDSPLNSTNTITSYKEENMYNVAVDILNGISMSIINTISDFYEDEYTFKSMFYGCMLPGAKNTLHMDNRYQSHDMKIKIKPYDFHDRSGILYLNDEYEGGYINFPKQCLKLKPKPGTFIFFEGNEDLPHEVTVVESGKRYNVICFFWPKSGESRKNTRELPEQEIQMSYDSLGLNL